MNVFIKHGSKTYPLAIDISGSGADLKEAIAAVTGVPVDRMKVMIKGVLKDTARLSSLNLQPIIGSATSITPPPAQAVTFLEDMNQDELADLAVNPAGLVNLGQTCYLNSSLQLLRKVLPLKTALTSYNGSSVGADAGLTRSLKHLFQQMQSSGDAPEPWALLTSLRRLAPQFAEVDGNGLPAQQDADEAWTQLVSALRSTMTGTGHRTSVIDELMALEVTHTMSCTETSDEEPTVTSETYFKLVCNISGSTNYLMSGIQESLDQTVEKISPSLNRTALYKSETRVSRLPEYLPIQMVRFYWRRDTQKKAKIMRKVKFPLQLDLLDIVTPELRERLRPINVARKVGDNKSLIDEGRIRTREREEVEALSRDTAGVTSGDDHRAHIDSGVYELCGMITHKGPSADSGHYMAWVRKDGDGDDGFALGEQVWLKYDDDKVSAVSATKVQSLDGGGEDSAAYILLYRAVRL
ncbi:deubiquitinating enzyme [Cryptotrichosporon argae]